MATGSHMITGLMMVVVMVGELSCYESENHGRRKGAVDVLMMTSIIIGSVVVEELEVFSN